MSQRLKGLKDGAEATVRDIRRRTRKQYSAEEKIRIVVAGLRGEDSIAELCRREGIAESLYYSWSKEFLEAGKKRFRAVRRSNEPARNAGRMEAEVRTVPGTSGICLEISRGGRRPVGNQRGDTWGMHP